MDYLDVFSNLNDKAIIKLYEELKFKCNNKKHPKSFKVHMQFPNNRILGRFKYSKKGYEVDIIKESISILVSRSIIFTHINSNTPILSLYLTTVDNDVKIKDYLSESNSIPFGHQGINSFLRKIKIETLNEEN